MWNFFGFRVMTNYLKTERPSRPSRYAEEILGRKRGHLI
jgi:hypothetical protein